MRLKIREERQKLGMLQREVYQNLCSKRHYLRIEKGEVIPSVYLLY
ncbi:TPA: helix-turn-helix domain-containing protein, partial [Streptococcus pneumoniae]